MAYDEHAVALVQQMEEIIERAGVDESVRRCGAILNAVELLVEQDEPPKESRSSSSHRRGAHGAGRCRWR